MGGVISADDPKWIEPFVGPGPVQFNRLVALPLLDEPVRVNLLKPVARLRSRSDPAGGCKINCLKGPGQGVSDAAPAGFQCCVADVVDQGLKPLARAYFGDP
jgi:hypothetical protein